MNCRYVVRIIDLVAGHGFLKDGTECPPAGEWVPQAPDKGDLDPGSSEGKAPQHTPSCMVG